MSDDLFEKGQIILWNRNNCLHLFFSLLVCDASFFPAGFLLLGESSAWHYHVEMAVFHDEVEIEDFEYDEVRTVCQSTET